MLKNKKKTKQKKYKPNNYLYYTGNNAQNNGYLQ